MLPPHSKARPSWSAFPSSDQITSTLSSEQTETALIKRKASLVVTDNAINPTDAKMLLSMLDLLPQSDDLLPLQNDTEEDPKNSTKIRSNDTWRNITRTQKQTIENIVEQRPSQNF